MNTREDLEAPLPLTAEERDRLLGLSLGNVSDYPRHASIHELFEAQVRRTPEAVAVAVGGERLSYDQLNRRANRLAHLLRRRGVKPETLVGISVGRSPAALVGILGILKAGAAYLPLDPEYPAERLSFMLEDSQARLVVSEKPFADRFAGVETVVLDAAEGGPAGECEHNPAIRVATRHLAYAIYTSGSTGRPKGVLVEHRSLVQHSVSAGEDYRLAPGDRVLQFTSLNFDASGEEIYPALLRGATLVLRNQAMMASTADFLRQLVRERITVLILATAYWNEICAELPAAAEAAGGDRLLPPELRLVSFGGEEAVAGRLERWQAYAAATGHRAQVFNDYGPTEATIIATRWGLPDPASGLPSGGIPIGRAIPNVRAYVLDDALELVPAGTPGELYLGGEAVARAYLRRQALTAERFIPDPFVAEAAKWGAGGEPGDRLYRTGDLACYLPDGNLGFLGRRDQQVKVRGFRIELGEISSALCRHPAVRDAVVILERGGVADDRLVAYVVERVEISGAELRRHLQQILPEYMVPAAYVFLPALPLTAGGKLDRRALPAPAAERPQLGSRYVAPRNQVEELLAGVWCELLGLDRVGVFDNFFELGGHSLLVGRLISRVRRTLEIELPQTDVFERPTVAAMAEMIACGGESTPETRLPPVGRAPRDQPLPLSFPQERVWFLNQLTPESIAYNFQMSFWLQGRLDIGALRRTLSEIVRRHEILRTRFPAIDGRPVQVIEPPAPLRLPVVDLRALPAERRQAAADQLVFARTQIAFDVTRLPLIDWILIRQQDDYHQLFQIEHHFVHDGWSISVLISELQLLYEAFAAGRPSPLPELPVQYADFALWQRQWMQGEVLEGLLRYWKKQLAGMPPGVEVPSDRPRSRRPGLSGDLKRPRLPDELYRELRAFSRSRGFTLYMTMLAAFYGWLHRYTGKTDLPVGVGVANRRVQESEALLGMIVNTLVLRGDLGGDPTFRELLARVRQITLDAYAHQDMPFEILVRELQPQRRLSHNPLFQVMFSFHDSATPYLNFAGMRVRHQGHSNRSAKTDLNVIVVPRAEQRVGLARPAPGEDDEPDWAYVRWEYSRDMFDPSTIERMNGHYLNLLRAIVADPDRRIAELPLLSAGERHQLLVEWNVTATRYPRNERIDRLFAARVERGPEAVAVVFGGRADEHLSYCELNRRANRLGHHLRALGVGPEVLVGIYLKRSLPAIVGILGILKAGGAYLPLDLSYPPERLAFMLEDAGAPVLVTTEELAATLPAALAERGLEVVCLDRDAAAIARRSDRNPPPEAAAGAENLAYVVYTSGSTGRPKGVAVSHRAVARLVFNTNYVALSPGDRVAQASTTSFDAATFELWGALLHGARLVGIAKQVTLLPEALAAAIRAHRITAMFLTTALFNQMARDEPAALRRVAHLLFGGEAVDPLRVREVLEVDGREAGRLLHVYGPTESTTFTTWHPVREVPDGARTIPIGAALANTEVCVLDRNLSPVPVGVPGELTIGGDGLARGYLRRPVLTAERFVPHPVAALQRAGERLYRTGDLVRYRPDGQIEFLGRNDFQVKVRGFRIELEEIELVLGHHPAVRAAAVVAVKPDTARRQDVPAGDLRLVAYVVREQRGTDLDVAELRAHLGKSLPSYMVPSAVVFSDSLPLSPNGKIDRAALGRREPPKPDHARLDGEEAFVAPETPAEKLVAGIWAEVLGVDRVGMNDNFFELGGHSLLATQVVSRLRRRHGVELPLEELFEASTAAGLAAVVERLEPCDQRREGMAGEVKPCAEDVDALLGRVEALPDQELDTLLQAMMRPDENP